tara:strand:+ start:165 stop:542 length:378 start_codon:yes stop_codon:yes gene_type:complete
MSELLLALLIIIPQLEGNPNGNPAENALGPYHITPVMVQEVNRIMSIKKLKVKYKHADALNERLAKHMTVVHLQHWGKQYEKRTGKKASIAILAAIHNKGPYGYQKEAGKEYGNRAKNIYEDMRK